jgi:acyl carrier protein
MNYEQKIMAIIAMELEININELKPTTDILADLGSDSIDNISIISHINHDCKINLTEDDVKDVRTIADLTQVVIKQSHNKNAK